jgi:hypothetical protein
MQLAENNPKHNYMALIKQIKARLKVLYPGVNLSNKRIEAIAAKIDAKVTEEDEIDDALSTYDEYNPFAEMAKEDDRERLRMKKESETKTPEQIAAEKKEAEGNDPVVDPDMPAWAKALVTSTQALAKGLESIQGEKMANTRKQQYESKLEGIPAKVKAKALKDFAKMKFETEDEFNEWLAETESDVEEMIQEESNNGLTNQMPVRGVKVTPGKVKPATDAELDEVMNAIR